MRYEFGHRRNHYGTDRRIWLWSNIFALVSNEIKDEDVEAMGDNPYIWEVKKTLQDKQGHPFFICVPVFKFEKFENASALFGYLVDYHNKRDPELKELIRMAYWAGIDIKTTDPHDMQKELQESLIKGIHTAEELDAWAEKVIPSTPETAVLNMLEGQVITPGLNAYLHFEDISNPERNVITIGVNNIGEWASAIPTPLKVSVKGTNLDVQVNWDDVKSIVPYRPFYFEKMDIRDRDEWFFKADTSVGEVTYRFNSDNKQLRNEALSHAGIIRYEGYLVPETFPSYKLMGRYYPGAAIGIHEELSVTFSNGMSGIYPAIWLARKYPGSPADGKVEVVGHSLETLAVRFSK